MDAQKCNLCSKRVTNLKQHLQSHTNVKKYECPTCNARFKRKDHLNSHFLIHRDEKPFECKHCGKCVKRKSELTAHIKMQHKKQKYKCEICDLSYVTTQSLKIHQVKEHNLTFPKLKEYKCVVCEKIFYQKSVWQSHLLIHKNEKSFECELCHKTFRQKNNLDEHMRVHEEEEAKKIECGLCARKFWTKGVMETHLLTYLKEKPYKCRFCPKSFTQPSGLRYHEIILHLNNIKKPHECLTCGAKFASRNYLQIHMRLTHNESRHFICEICEKGFKCRDKLKRHQNSVHNFVECKFWCFFCFWKFHSKEELFNHLLSHIREKPFACRFCDKSFPTFWCRTSHIKRMHDGTKGASRNVLPNYSQMKGSRGEILHFCTICNFQFTSRQGVKKHLQAVHSLAKRFQCQVEDCDKAFKRRDGLRRHEKNVHPQISNAGRRFWCVFCTREGYVERWDLYKHLLTHIRERPYAR